MTPLREKMVRDMQLRRLSDNTQRVYTHAVFALAKHYMQAPDRLSERQLQDYVLYMLNVRKLSWSTCDTNVAGLQFFYGVTLGRKSMRLVLPPRKSEKRLPEILSAEEIVRLFAAARTLVTFGHNNLGGKTGFIAVLHTWDQKLNAHFHLHCLVPAGALSENNDRWIDTPENFLFPVRALAMVFRDRAAGDKRDIMTLPAEAFIRRFLLHTLPAGFVRIRHFGFLANRAKKNALPLCRQLLGVAPQPPAPERKSDEDLLHELTGENFFRCPCCKQGSMRSAAELPKPGFSSFDTS